MYYAVLFSIMISKLPKSNILFAANACNVHAIYESDSIIVNQSHLTLWVKKKCLRTLVLYCNYLVGDSLKFPCNALYNMWMVPGNKYTDLRICSKLQSYFLTKCQISLQIKSFWRILFSFLPNITLIVFFCVI